MFGLSINPTYFCNFRCSFCYLTEQQLADKTFIGLDKLEAKLQQVCEVGPIDHIDLYGGEIGTMRKEYLESMHEVLKRYYNGKINVITNLSHIHPYFMRDDVQLSVSYDFECREVHERVLKNIAIVQKDVHVLLLAGACLVEKDVEGMIKVLNTLHNIKTVEIKPYSTNQANCETVSFKDYEEFVKRWIDSETEKRFAFMNEVKIQESLAGTANSFSDDHIYVTPTGRFGVLEFDLNDNEFFLEFDDMDEYVAWTKREHLRVSANKFCSGCEYFGSCLSEHLREVKNLDNSCNGFKLLLDWYNERVED